MRIDLSALGRALGEGLQHGRHLGSGRGDGGEFYDFRAYAPGDSSRLIDWRLLGRTDRAYLRRYRQESQLNLLLIVDSSASMNYGGLKPRPGLTKFRRATELAAALAYSAVRGGDRVGALVAGGAGSYETVEIGAGWGAYQRVMHMLETVRPEPRAAAALDSDSHAIAMAHAIEQGAGLMSRSGLLVVISDGFEDPEAIARAAGRVRWSGKGSRFSSNAATSSSTPGRALSFVQVLADDELDLHMPEDAFANLIDPETGYNTMMNVYGASQLGELMRAHIAKLRAALIGVGARHILAPLGRDPVSSLRELTSTRPASVPLSRPFEASNAPAGPGT